MVVVGFSSHAHTHSHKYNDTQETILIYDVINNRTSTETKGTITLSLLRGISPYCSIHTIPPPVCTSLVLQVTYYHTPSETVVITRLRNTTDLPQTTNKPQSNHKSLKQLHLKTTCPISMSFKVDIIGKQFSCRQRPRLVFDDAQFLRNHRRKTADFIVF